MLGILRWFAFLFLVCLAVPSNAQGIIEVFGAPPAVCSDGSCGKQALLPTVIGSVAFAPVRVVQGTSVVATRAVQGTVGAVVNRDPQAYSHALREAQIQASRGRVGHYLGCAPGTRFSGVGNSFSTSQPNHCTTRGTIVARAYAIGRDGRVYWSAHYR